MTLLDRPRSRVAAASTFMVLMALLGLLFARHMTGVQAARRVVEMEQASIIGQPAPTAHRGATPVLVELFTSEGCSSCPPADSLLARLQQQQPVGGAEIIALEEHVDYWEQLGWHDRFSARQFTERQTAYGRRFHLDDDYTPQMIVDGAEQFVGNDSSHALRAIAQAARTPKLALTLSAPTLDIDHRVNVSVFSPSATNLPKADLYAALVETMASTQVLHGENGGRTLYHVSVVRVMQKIGSSDQLANPLFFSFGYPKDAITPNLRVIVFVQHPDQGPILAAASSAAPTQPH